MKDYFSVNKKKLPFKVITGFIDPYFFSDRDKGSQPERGIHFH